MKKTRIMSVRNSHYINVRRMCASCHRRTVDDEGDRICEPKQKMVEQKFKCRYPLLHDYIFKYLFYGMLFGLWVWFVEGIRGVDASPSSEQSAA